MQKPDSHITMVSQSRLQNLKSLCSNSSEDMFHRMKIVGSRDLGHAYFLGKIICAPAWYSSHKVVYQIWSL